jgi:hypothetical protein
MKGCPCDRVGRLGARRRCAGFVNLIWIWPILRNMGQIHFRVRCQVCVADSVAGVRYWTQIWSSSGPWYHVDSW